MIYEHVLGRIKAIDEQGYMHIVASVPNLDRAIHREYSKVEVILPDGRTISAEQRRKIYALIGEVAEYCEGFRNAETIEDTKQSLKWDFILERMESQERRLFSLSDCDMTTASSFISYLIDFIIRNDIPTAIPLIEQAEDIGQYIYSCLANKKCCVCGQKADLHHCEGSRIGMGANRDEAHNLGREVLALCRKHHTECHNDEAGFIAKYHLEPIKMDERLCKIYKVRK